jgi:hypothetical protein
MGIAAATAGAFFILLSVLCSGCNGRISNIKPGDADYPIINSAPTRTIKVYEDPPDTKVQFIVGYRATESAEPTDPQKTCEYEVGGGVFDFFNVTLNPNWKNSGQLILDRYQPGRCKWAFAGVWYTVNGPADQPGELLFYQDDPTLPSTINIDIWCFVVPDRPRGCGDIGSVHASFDTHVSSEVLRQILDSGQGSGLPRYVGPNASLVNIRFHDLNAYMAEHRFDH